MRRALLLAVVAVPALASAQTVGTGTILFQDANNDLAHGPYISATECSSGTVYLSWNAQPSGTWPGSANYTVYASNKESTAPNCITAPDNQGTFAQAIGITLTNQLQTVNLQPYNTQDFVTAANYTCATTADTTIYVCVQAFSTADGTTKIGYAKGTLTLSTSKPAAPTGVTAIPADDGALQISWTAPIASGSYASPYDYEITVTSTDPANPGSQDLTNITATTVLVKGLTNNVTYDVEVWSRSKAGNKSDQPGTTQGTPVHVLNFWDVYHTAYGGKEQGGCSTGAAGPVALLGLAALLAKLRRRA